MCMTISKSEYKLQKAAINTSIPKGLYDDVSWLEELFR